MKAIILAAGRGSRMKTMTEDRPKCLVELCGKPLLGWQLSALHGAGISEVAIVTGYQRELLASHASMEFHNPCWAVTNMVSSLECARLWLQAEPCIVSYSDIFYDASAVRALMETNAELAITYDPNWRALWERRFVDPLSDAETFIIDKNSNLTEIGQRAKQIEEIQGQYMGLLRFTPASWQKIEVLRGELEPAVRDKQDMTGLLWRLIAEHRVAIRALPYTDKWGEIDSMEDLAIYDSSSRCK